MFVDKCFLRIIKVYFGGVFFRVLVFLTGCSKGVVFERVLLKKDVELQGCCFFTGFVCKGCRVQRMLCLKDVVYRVLFKMRRKKKG